MNKKKKSPEKSTCLQKKRIKNKMKKSFSEKNEKKKFSGKSTCSQRTASLLCFSHQKQCNPSKPIKAHQSPSKPIKAHQGLVKVSFKSHPSAILVSSKWHPIQAPAQCSHPSLIQKSKKQQHFALEKRGHEFGGDIWMTKNSKAGN